MEPQLFSNATILSFGLLIGSVCGLVRNFLIARYLSVEDFGVAASLAMAMSLVEMTSNLGTDRFLIQSPNGDDPIVQATAQTLQVLRGLASGLLLLLLAWPIAVLIQAPSAWEAFAWVSLAPVIRGVVHLDIVRYQRDMKFWPILLCEVGPQLILTLLVTQLASLAGDYRVMLWMILSQSVMYFVMSHLVAQRRWALGWDRPLFCSLMRFGVPLLLNGFVMFAIFHGDRLIVGANYTPKILGWFSVALTLCFVPSVVLCRINSAFLLTPLSRIQDESADATDAINCALRISLTLASFLAVGCCLCGPALVTGLYGERYAEAASMVVLIGFAQAFRVARTGPVTVSISKGDTRNPLLANLARALGLLVAGYLAFKQFRLEMLLLTGICAEVLAYLVSLGLCIRSHQVDATNLIFVCLTPILVSIPLFLLKPFFPGERMVIELVVGACIAASLALALAKLLGVSLDQLKYSQKKLPTDENDPAAELSSTSLTE
ncbi:MAG: oligosaccharide flippase family protein [Planctomycetota bacterium]|nr:oligosaccharide flippase family protein [Planctomycetota bacterium]